MRKLLKLMVVPIIALCLTGCDDVGSVIDNWNSELQKRITDNQAEVDRIYEAGLLSKEQAEALKKGIASQEKRIDSMEPKDFSEYTVKIDGTASQAVKPKGDKAIGIELVSTDNKAVQELMNNLDYEVYVLKKDPLANGKGANSLATLDLIAQEVEKAKNGEKSDLDKYFISSGRKVWDTSLPENQIVKDTVSSGSWTGTGCGDSGVLTNNVNIMGKHFIGVKTEEHENQSHRDSVSAIEFKIKEFNKTAVDRLVGASDVNKDIYVIIGKKCYLMQYPVYYVSGFEKTNNTYKAVYEKSELQINILTNKIMDSQGRECFNEAGNILNVQGEGGYSELGQASFVVDGLKGEPTTFGYDKAEAEAKKNNTTYTPTNADNFGRVVLRDYLELNYMPNVVDGEHLVALGRKFRLTKFTGDGKEEIGLFIDREGNAIENSKEVEITDIMDIKSGSNDSPDHKIKLDIVYSANANNNTNSSTNNTSSNTNNTTSVIEVGGNHKKLLETTYADKIGCSVMFPSSLIATNDTLELGKLQSQTSSNTTTSTDIKIKHFMYGMALDIDPFQSNLFSGWIELKDPNSSIGGLNWWNAWLKTGTYNYFIDRDKLLNFLTGNYSYELSENNIIVLDLDTIKNIQQQYDSEEKLSSISIIHSYFKILGLFLMTYSLLILASWVYDVNIVVGPRIMTLITFGRWRAVSGLDELPSMNPKETKYMNFSKTLRASIVFICFGVFIIFVDIIEVVDWLVTIFSGLAQIFIDSLFG